MSEQQSPQQHSRQRRRMDFGHLVDRIFWLLLTGSALLIVNQLHEMGNSVTELNQRIATVIEKVIGQDKRIERLERADDARR